MRRLLLAGAALFAAFAIVTPAAASAATGAISGTVTDASTGAPVPGVDVSVVSSTNHNQAAVLTCTGPDGTYTASGLPGGTYLIGYDASDPNRCGTPDGDYVSVFYGGGEAPSSAAPVGVTDGSTTSGINVAMAPAGEISGTVTDASTHLPLGGVGVDVYGDPWATGQVCTGPDGTYRVLGLPTGAYTVRFHVYSPNVCLSNGPFTYPNYEPQYYNGRVGQASPDEVSVVGGKSSTGIDAALSPGGEISGRVTDASTGGGLRGVWVVAYDANSAPPLKLAGGGDLGSVCTRRDGSYTIPALSTGAYRVYLDPNGGPGCGGAGRLKDGYYGVAQYYGATSSSPSDEGSPVPVTAGQTTPNIDVALGNRAVATPFIIGAVKTQGRTATLRVGCSGAHGAACRVTALMTATEFVRGSSVVALAASAAQSRMRRRTVLLGKATLVIPSGGKRVLRISLNAQGARLLARFHQFRATLALGSARPARRVVVFRR